MRYEKPLVGNMTQGVAEEYFNGYVDITADSKTGFEMGMEKGEALFPSAPQEFVRDAETGTYVIENITDSYERTRDLWLNQAGGLTVSDIQGITLPEVFADSGASVDDRARALQEALAEALPSRTISFEDARRTYCIYS